MKSLLQPTELLDFQHPAIQQIIQQRNWIELGESERIKAVYNFVRDEISFGYNRADNLPASQILIDGMGQCNTKSTMLMALLRAVGVPCRLHGFTIDKALQKGAISGIWYRLSPKSILHTWVEVYFNNQWFALEGVILDKPYLQALQFKFSDCVSSFCGYGAYTENFQNPTVDWNENDTFIQKNGINADYGIFDTPDQFYKLHMQRLSPLKKWIFENIARHSMNGNVDKIRSSHP